MMDNVKLQEAGYRLGKAKAHWDYKEEGKCENKYPKYSSEWWGYREVESEKLAEEIGLCL
jgi:hypothetical protein